MRVCTCVYVCMYMPAYISLCVFRLICNSVILSLQVHFLICISANITHLRDNRFATLNAYETEELRNSKHSVLDTNM